MHTRRLLGCKLDHYTIAESHPRTYTVSCVFAPGVPVRVHMHRISSALLYTPSTPHTPLIPPSYPPHTPLTPPPHPAHIPPTPPSRPPHTPSTPPSHPPHTPLTPPSHPPHPPLPPPTYAVLQWRVLQPRPHVGRGLHSSTFQLNLSRFGRISPFPPV